MQFFENIYRNRTVLVTGHTGFKGSWLVEWLVELGANVIGYSHGLPSNPCHYELLKPNVNSVVGDLLDYSLLVKAIAQYRPSIIFHLAAQAIVKTAIEEPVETFRTNVLGTVNLLEAIRETGSVKAFVNVTSDKCYYNKEIAQGYKEDDRLGGKDPYSASKSCAEIVNAAWQSSYFVPDKYGKEHDLLLASVRAGNVIGGGDWAAHRLVPDIMRAFSAKTVLEIRKPNAVRPWQHVLDPLSGYLLLGLKLLKGEKSFASAWNFGPTDKVTTPVKSLVEEFKEHLPDLDLTLRADSSDNLEADLLALDCSKAVKTLNWQPIWNTKQAIEKTAKWYQSFYDKQFLETREDLSNYCREALKQRATWISAD